MKLLNTYQNGPVTVEIFDDGTKTREWDEIKFGFEPELEFPESMDIKITNCCDMGCLFCHERSIPNGKHGDLKFLQNLFDKSNLPAGIEFAIGGGNPMDCPGIDEFLDYCKDKGFIINMTMNLNHLLNREKYGNRVVEWLKDNKIKGLGISINEKNLKEYAKCDWLWRESNNIVLHVIEGIVDYYDFDSELCKLQNEYGFIPKVLILGWKDFGRFGDMSNDIKNKTNFKTIDWERNIISFIKRVGRLGGVVSFDNLAVERLHLLDKLPLKIIDTQYMGKDGTHTMYCDLVNKQFTKQSTSKERFDIGDKSLRDMYEFVYNNRETIR